MEWWVVLLLILGSLLVLMALGFPVAFCFLFVSFVAVILYWGIGGTEQLIISMRRSIVTFSLLPIPLFILMGTTMFHSGVAPLMIDTLDKWLGRLPGRLSFLAVGGGTLLSALTGASIASVAILGSSLLPEMEKRGYKSPMSLGPILGSGGLAIMIPPSALAVLLGSIGEISIGDILLAIIIPGGIMAVLYFTYIVIRILLQPDLAPHYESQAIPIMKKITLTVRYVLPVGIIVFLVVGVIFLGVATPTEAASTGALGTFGLVALYGKLNWRVVKKAVSSGLWTSSMVLMIVLGAKSYSEALAFSGASLGLAEFVSSLNVGPMTIFISMQVVILFSGMFMSTTAVVMITLPIFLPIIRSLGFNEIWFAVVMLLNLEIGMTSPPFGLNLFVMKSVAPTGTSMGDIIRAALPFIYCDIVAMLLIIIFPSLALWLPGLKF